MATNNYNQVATTGGRNNTNDTKPTLPKETRTTRCGKTLIKIDMGMKRGTPIK